MANRTEIGQWLVVNNASLKNSKARKLLAKSLATVLNFWSDSEIEVFINEMRGLQLHRAEDRVIFCDMLFTWIKEESHESSCT